MTKPHPLPCPYLRKSEANLPSTHTRAHRKECGLPYYISCLELAQSCWLQHRPSQAILQLDKAMMAILPADHSILDSSPIPYEAMLWVIENTPSELFLGNPVRHFQHLASRMNWKQPQPELRIARAWCCFQLAEMSLPHEQYTRDYSQIKKESLNIPNARQSIELLEKHSTHQSESALVKKLFSRC